jgi:hypothetical protein
MRSPGVHRGRPARNLSRFHRVVTFVARARYRAGLPLNAKADASRRAATVPALPSAATADAASHGSGKITTYSNA